MPEHDGLPSREAANRCLTARLLAQGNYGSIKACPSGCTHLTFAAISLHFRDIAEFEQFAKKTLIQIEEAREQDAFCMLHRGTTLVLDAPSTRALTCLLGEGISTLQWFRGELEFSDQDFRHLVECQA